MCGSNKTGLLPESGFLAKLGNVVLILALTSISHSCFGSDAFLDKPLTLAEIVNLTLQKNPDILIQKETIRGKRGEFTQSGAAFDTLLTSAVEYSDSANLLTKSNRDALGRSFLRSGNIQLGLSSAKMQQNGTTFKQSLEITGAESGLPGARLENRAKVTFAIIHPLGRGRGRNSQANTQREAAILELDAALASLRISVNRAIFEAVQAYWNYSGSCQRLQILQQAKERAIRLAQETEELIAADERPVSERSQIQANLASKQADYIGGETQVRQTRRALGLVLGISPAEISNLNLPEQSLPDLQDVQISLSLQENLILSILDQRPELENLRLRMKAAQRRTAGGRNQEKPQVDLSLNAGYSGLNEGFGAESFFSPMSNRIPGMNFGFQISSDLPQSNFQARGIRMQLESNENTLNIVFARTDREIRTSLNLALFSVSDNLRQVDCSRKAVEAYKQAVDNEQAKLSQGMSTIVDLLFVEDRLTSSMLADLQSRIELANSLNALFYESGAIASKDGEKFVVDVEGFFMLPPVFQQSNSLDKEEQTEKVIK